MMQSTSTTASSNTFRQILGIKFFTGTASEAVARMNDGGLLVVPAAPALMELPLNTEYREALLNADLTITDSAFMVLAWNFIQRDRIPRTSGLTYLRVLIASERLKTPNTTFWIMPGEKSAERNIEWLRTKGITVNAEDHYIAPMYPGKIDDPGLLATLRSRRPKHIVIALGGGTQERLGLYLKRHLEFRPSIHCIGAAIAFLSGDQVHIPAWADKLFLGWLFRCCSEPRRYIARYWSARKLLPLLLRYRERLPQLDI